MSEIFSIDAKLPPAVVADDAVGVPEDGIIIKE